MNIKSPCMTCPERYNDKIKNETCHHCQARIDYTNRIGRPGLAMGDDLTMNVEKQQSIKKEELMTTSAPQATPGHTPEFFTLDGITVTCGLPARKNGAVPLLDKRGVVVGLHCTTCNEPKLLADFYNNAKTRYGVMNICKTCFEAKYGSGSRSEKPRSEKPKPEPKPAPAPTPAAPEPRTAKPESLVLKNQVPELAELTTEPLITAEEIAAAIEKGISKGVETAMMRISARITGFLAG